MPSPFDALDALTIEPPAPAPAAPEPEAPAVEPTDEPKAPEAESLGGFADSFDKFFAKEKEKEASPEPKIEDEVLPPEGEEASVPKDDDELETPEMTEAKKKMSIKAAQAFDLVKSNAKAKIEALKEKLKLAEEKAATATNGEQTELAAKIQAAEEKLKEQQARLAYYDVREHPEYKEAVEAPTLAIRDQLERLSKANSLEFGELVKAVAETDPAKQGGLLDAITDGMRERDKVKLWQLVEDWGVVIATEQRIKAEAPKAYEEVQARRQAETAAQKAASEKEWKTASEAVWTKLQEKIPGMKNVKPDELRAEYDRMQWDTLPATERAAALASSVTFVPIVKHLTADNAAKAAKIKELEATLGRYRKATPSAGGGGTTHVPKVNDSPGGFLDAIEMHANAVGR